MADIVATCICEEVLSVTLKHVVREFTAIEGPILPLVQTLALFFTVDVLAAELDLAVLP